MAIRIAVDAMGGDHAPGVVVEGAIRAVQAAPGKLDVLLFGREDDLRAALDAHGAPDDLPLQIIDAPEVIGMGEAPAAAVKGKPHSSIHRGLGACKQGMADAFVSAGNTGAVMAAALFILGRVEGVARPSVIGFYPTVKSFCIVLDVGTNVDCKPEHLVQFAQMGALYVQRVLKRPDPVVALMNVGEEPGKGNEQVKAAYPLLQEAPGINFRGNIEGRDLLHHAADVVVCDGFVGNVMLKLGESLATALGPLFRAEMERQGLDAEQQRLVGGVLRGMLRPFDYDTYGGAPLLGVAGNVLIGHGSASARAMERLLHAAAEVVEQNVAGAIADIVGA